MNKSTIGRVFLLAVIALAGLGSMGTALRAGETCPEGEVQGVCDIDLGCNILQPDHYFCTWRPEIKRCNCTVIWEFAY